MSPALMMATLATQVIRVMILMMTALTLVLVDQARVMMSLTILMMPVIRPVTVQVTKLAARMPTLTLASQDQASLYDLSMTVTMNILNLNTLATLLRMSRHNKKKMPTLSNAISNKQLIKLAARALMLKT